MNKLEIKSKGWSSDKSPATDNINLISTGSSGPGLGFTNDNKTISIEPADVDFTTFTTESAGQSVTIKVDSPEIQGPLFNSPSDQASPAYANRAVFIVKDGTVMYKWVAPSPGEEPNYEEIQNKLKEI